jgi:hypothetical protein
MERQKSRGLFVMDKALNISLFAQVKGELIFDTTLSDGAYRFYIGLIALLKSRQQPRSTQKRPLSWPVKA